MTFNQRVDQAAVYLDAAEKAGYGDAETLAKVDRWLRMAQVHALLAIAEAINAQ